MISFEEWLVNNHPETLDEGKLTTRDSSPKYIEIEKEVAMKGYDYQFFRYLQQLTIASKNVLIQN